MKNSILFLLLSSFLVACSGPGGKTSASLKVTIGGLNTADGSPITQIVITGQSQRGERFARVLTDGNDTVSINLPNGSWNFLAMAWEGTLTLNGKVRCAYSTVSLTGSPEDIPLAMTNAKCFDGTLNVHSPDSTAPTIPAFRITNMHACRIDVQRDITSATDDCDFDITDQNPRGAVIGSMRVGIQGGDQFGANFIPNNQFLGSACASSDNYGSIFERFPAIKPSYFFPLVALGYPAALCNPSRGVLRATFANNTLRMIEDGISTVSTYAQFTDDAVCAAANANNTTAINQIGMGMSNAPFGICNLAQLRHWQENFASHDSDPVALLANLDLLPWIKAGNPGPGSPAPTPYHSCLKDGSTFIPLGATGPDCTLGVSPILFTGTLNGLGHSISHFRFEAENDNDIGLFRKFGASGLIVSLKLISPSVRGANNVGAFVGNAMLGGALYSLTVENGDVEGDDYVGMIAGIANNTALKSSLHATGKVRGDDDYIGGLIGDAGAGSDMISQASFAGEVISESGEYVGGIAGQAGNIFEAVVSGYVQGANNIGGIAGQASVIRDARVTATVIGTMDIPGTVHGGIAGSASLVERAMFFGSFYSYSSSGNVGIISGSGSRNDTYSSQTHTPVNSGLAANQTGTFASAGAAWNQICDSNTVWNCNDQDTQFVIDGNDGIDLPRLGFENHPCMLEENLKSVAEQRPGRGGSTNPIRLCRIEQINEINTYPGLHYSLLQDIAINNLPEDPVTEIAGIVHSPNSFTGTFNGNGHALHGLVYNPVANYGLFGSIGSTGVVKNLKLYNFRLDSSNTGLSLISGNSAGLIENIQTKSITLKASSGIGGITVVNTGTIRNINFEGKIYSNSQTGSIAVSNNGIIEDVISQATLTAFSQPAVDVFDNPIPFSGQAFGGIVGSNTKTINRAQFDGKIDSYHPGWTLTKVGGLVGANIGGSISDSVVSSKAQLNLSSGITEAGTLIGFHNASIGGTLSRLLSQTLLIHPNASNYGAINLSTTIGEISGGAIPLASFASYGAVASFVDSHQSAMFDFVTGECIASDLGDLDLLSPSTSYIIAPTYNDNFLPIEMVFINVPSNILSYPGTDESFCSKFNGPIRALADGGALIYYRDIDHLSSNGYNIVNYDTGADAQRNRVFAAHIDHMKGLPLPANRPVWIFEEGKYELFRVDK